jgi:hypothetical protein
LQAFSSVSISWSLGTASQVFRENYLTYEKNIHSVTYGAAYACGGTS